MATTTLPTLATLHTQQGDTRKATATTSTDAHKAAKEFEALFIGQMMQQMFSGVGSDKLFGGGHGEDTFRSMLIDQYGKDVANGKGIGLSQAIERQLLKMQEA